MKRVLMLGCAAAALACGGGATHAAASRTTLTRDEIMRRIESTGEVPAEASRDMVALGRIVRERDAQLQFCYNEALRHNPRLAGTATLAITIAGVGDVRQVAVTRRSWSGRGVKEAETCLRSKILAWKFPAAEEEEGTYSFSFSFTK